MTPCGARPAISVLSPAYRTEAVVARMIESMRAQTSDDWELVVVDNGMSDEMARIVGGYGHDPRIVLVRQENRGSQGGVNAAAAVAGGRYLAVVNSDDQVMPRFCERLVGVLDAAPDIAAVTCDAYRLDEQTGARLPLTYLQNARARPPDPRHRITVAELVEQVCPYYSGAVRSEVWHEVGGYCADSPLVADLDLWLRLVVAGHSMVAVPEPLGVYSERADSMSRGARSIVLLEEARECSVMRWAVASGRPEDLAALRRELRRSRARRSTTRARIALVDGDPAAARRHAAAAVRERRSPRDIAILAGLTLAPWVLARLYRSTRQEDAAPPAVQAGRATERGTP